MRPRISVIIPTYNRFDLLARAVASVHSQEGANERFDLEAIVVDDASTDETVAVVGRAQGSHYVRAAVNAGPSAARNLGIRAATGDYVAFLDDDDVWLPWKLRRQLEVLEADPELSAVYGQEIKKSDTELYVWPDAPECPSGWIFKSLLRSCPINTSSVLIRRAALDRAGYFDEKLRCWEDYDMWLRIALDGPFRFLPGPALIYQMSNSGRFYSAVRGGEAERDLRHVVNAGLDRLAAREPVPLSLRRAAQVSIVARTAGQFLALAEPHALRAYLLAAVRENPWLIQGSELRWMLTTAAIPAGVAANLDRVREYCGQIKEAAAGHGLAYRLAARRLEAEIWRKVAVALSADPNTSRASARRAALRAVVQHPATMGRALMHVLVGLSVS